MATRMGLPKEYPYAKLPSDDVEALMQAHVIPDQATISEEDMVKIVNYFAENAPEKAISQKRKIQPSLSLPLFEIVTVSDSRFSMQNIILKTQEDKFILGFEDKGTFSYDILKQKSEKISSYITTDMASWKDKYYSLDLINIDAHNLPKDQIKEFKNITDKMPKKILEGLIRPVSLDIADINNDQKPDFLISEFGDYLGRLSLFLSTQTGHKKIVLKANPGACKAYFKDINNDGQLDILALMSQGREEVLLFEKSKNGFSEKTIMTFPPSYGSNDMKIADMDADGLDDLILTNGDNADISSSLKNYHGIRILKNVGKGNFKEAWFYPIYGASKVETADFDSDGKMDMMVISHFGDFSTKEEENLLFFKNEGSLNFKPSKPQMPLNGRPLTMAKVDFDRDGDMDIIIGNYVDHLTDPGYERMQNWNKEKVSFWILKNNKK